MATWMVREGSDDEYLEECFQENYVAIGWKEVRGLFQLEGTDQNNIYSKLKEIYPTSSSNTVGAFASQIHSFVNKIYGGDFILVPSGKGKKVSIGYVLGVAAENPSNMSMLATRRVLWLVKQADRQEFFKNVKNTSAFGNPRTVVQVGVNHDDIRAYVERVTAQTFWKLLGDAGVNTWVFQSNPSKWNLLKAIEEDINHDWAANQNRDRMKIGDVILFRQSEPNSGVYAVGHLMRGAINRGANEFGEWGVIVGFDYKVELPLLKSEIAVNVELSSMTQINGLQGSNFSMPTETGQKLLKYLQGRLKSILAPIPVEPNYWWCNVGVTKKPAIATGTLWAHAASKNGAILTHHTDMKRVRKGDIILLYADMKIVAMGSCTEESIDATRPTEYPDKISSAEDDSNVPGFKVRTNFKEFEVQIPFEDVEADLRDLVDEKGPLASRGGIKMGYLYPLSQEFGAKFMEKYGNAGLLLTGGIKIKNPPINSPLTELARKLLVSEEWLTEVIGQISQSKQAIFYGPPGTGKTFIGKEIAEYLATKQNVELIQFHPSYSYEDFFEGFRPTETANGTISLEKVAGPLKRIAKRAYENPGSQFVLIIDEINRGNLAKVFGELYFLLEYREEAVSLMYSKEEKFMLPSNLIFVGTMNTADRSIALVDSAIRRRFKFIHLDPMVEPCLEILPRWLKANGLSNTAALLLENLNRALEKYEFSVGPAYFMKTKDQSEENLKRIWKYSIEPLLEEYFYGEWDEKRLQFAFIEMIP